jgi:hypothetical protein
LLLLFTTWSVIRTGRHKRKHSPQGPALETSPDTARHKSSSLDFRPRRNLPGRQVGRKLRPVRFVKVVAIGFVQHIVFV